MISWFVRPFLLLCALSIVGPAAGGQVASAQNLTIEEVVKLAQAGFSDDLLVTKIKKNGKAFDLSTDELIELRKAGVSDTVIRYLLDPSQPYEPRGAPIAAPPSAPSAPSPAAKPAASKNYPDDPHASKVPFESGLFYFEKNAPIKIEMRTLLASKEGAGLGKILLKKGKTIAYVAGAASRTRLRTAAPTFYLRLPEGKSIGDFVLIALDRKSDRREIETGPAGAKQELKADAIRIFDSLEVGPYLFRLTPANLVPGEYMFFIIGSAEPDKGSAGKGYDFAIDEAAQKNGARGAEAK